MGTLREIRDRVVFRLRMIVDQRFDRRFGVDTGGVGGGDDISPAQKRGACYYLPTPVSVVRSMLGSLTIDHSAYTFIDLGSGKGRVLLLASYYPYKRIIGVELSRRLHQIAENNIRVWKSPRQKCFRIESACMDACDFALPPDPLILFLFNPFKPAMVAQIVDRIQQSVRDTPRPIQILYYGSNREIVDEILTRLHWPCREVCSKQPFSLYTESPLPYRGLLLG